MSTTDAQTFQDALARLEQGGGEIARFRAYFDPHETGRHVPA